MRTRRRRLRTRAVVAVLACSAVVLIVAALLFGHDKEGLSQWAGAISAFTAFLAFAVPLSERLTRSAAGEAADANDQDQERLMKVAQQLAAAVADQWRSEARARRLQDPWPLPVRWQPNPDLSDDAAAPAPAGGGTTASGGTIETLADMLEG